MLKLLKTSIFWCILFSLAVCLINVSGNDDKNILIFLTNPISLSLVKWLTTINLNPETTMLFRPLIYLLHLLFWGGLGWLLDTLARKIKRW